MNELPALRDVPVHDPLPSGDPLAMLRMVIVDLDAQRCKLAEAGDLTALATGLVNFRKVVADLRAVESMIEADVANLVPDHGPHTIDGVGVLEVHRSSTKKWDGQLLLSRLALDMIDPATGEKVYAVTTDVLKKVLPQASAASASWKSTGLKDIGIDPADYCQTEYWRKTVRIVTSEA